MKSPAFWIGRFIVTTVIVFAVLFGVYLLRGAPVSEAWTEALIWSLISASIFVIGRYRQARKGIACALCRDTIEDGADRIS